MADLTKTTTLVNGDVFDPQVVSDMINAKVAAKAAMSGYIKVNNDLEGVPGSQVTIPKWGYIGAAEEYEEGTPIDTTKMAYTTAQYGIKKIGKGVMLTDEAQLSGYGNPMGTANNQIAMSISEKLDNDRVECLYDSRNVKDASTAAIKYSAVVDGIDMFNEEEDSKKVILIHSKQKTQLRKDTEFLAADKLGADMLVSGAIGKIAGCDIVVSNKVRLVSYVKDNSAGTVTISAENLAEYQAQVDPSTTLVVGDKVKALTAAYYLNPIIKLNNDAETEDDMPAVTYFLKRGQLVEHERQVGVGDSIVCTAYGKEGSVRGVASKHGDPEHLWTQLKMGYTMDTFRKAVKAAMMGDTTYKVKITSDTLNVRKGAGVKYGITAVVKKNEVFTIVDEKMNGSTKWGKLKSGAGWISLKYTKCM